MAKHAYEYKTMPLADVIGVTRFPAPQQSYLSQDEPVIALRQLLAAGYRWIRTDDFDAVFERIVEVDDEPVARVPFDPDGF